MSTDELKDKRLACKRIHEKAREFRGRFLDSVAVIERNIAIILTEYFCTADEFKKELFYKEIVERFSLYKKSEILINIVQNDYPRYWDENQQFLKDIDEIRRFRNALAHSIVDISEVALRRPIEEGVAFVQWKKGEPVTDEQINDWEIRANMVASTLTDIKRLLPFKEIP